MALKIASLFHFYHVETVAIATPTPPPPYPHLIARYQNKRHNYVINREARNLLAQQ